MPCSFACILANQIYGLWLCVLFSCAAVAEDAATTTPGFAETNAVTNIHLAHEFVVERSRTPAFVLHRNERKMVCDPSLRPVTGVCFYVFKSTLLLTHTPKYERVVRTHNTPTSMYENIIREKEQHTDQVTFYFCNYNDLHECAFIAYRIEWQNT